MLQFMTLSAWLALYDTPIADENQLFCCTSSQQSSCYASQCHA